MTRLLRCLTVVTTGWLASSLDAADSTKYEIKVEWYDPNARHDIPLVCFQVMRDDPEIICQPFSPLALQTYDWGKVMALATKSGPDVFNMEIFQISTFIRQGFLHPLNEFIGEDQDGGGVISDDEAIWPHWKTLSPLNRKIATWNGKVHTIPGRYFSYGCLVYRKDLLREAGIDPNRPPRDWDEFFLYMQRLTWPQRKENGATRRQVGFFFDGSLLNPWVWAANGDLVEEGKTNPRTGKTWWFPKEETMFRDPETGDSLLRSTSRWKATLDTPAMQAALDFLWKLFYQPWIRDPATGEPINLSASDAQTGSVQHPKDGHVVRFRPADVIRGVTRVETGGNPALKTEMLTAGEVACIPITTDVLSRVQCKPDQIGFWAFPPRVAGDPAVVAFEHHWLGMSGALAGEANRAKRAKAWKIMSALGSELGQQMYVRSTVESGFGQFLDPEALMRAGLTEYIELIPANWRSDYQRVLQHSRISPFNENWLPVSQAILGRLVSDMMTREKFDYRKALKDADVKANTRVMVDRPKEEMAWYQRIAMAIVLAILAVLVAGGALLARKLRRQAASGGGRNPNASGTVSSPASVILVGTVHHKWMPWLMLLPALALIAIWSYYPTARTMVMAFQDYKIMGEQTWIGFDNFIRILLDPDFYHFLLVTFRYVVYSLALTFVTPIALALMLNEIPFGKRFFRTMYFLPQISSGLVIALLWKQMYAPERYGLLNQAVARLGELFGQQWGPVRWLQDPQWAMPAVIICGLWAGVGVASLIYLAALKTVSDDLYEAAELDGASVWKKIWHITLPTIYPIIIINFVGAVIGTFQSSQNIFVMTGGAADTMVLGLAIWYEAFVYLKFGSATAMAWVLASLLIGFTVWQLRLLQSVEMIAPGAKEKK
ncbi:MAG: extracellular solute-binding protein [Verrucomicrobia bacterium]|nr:extracellular solute-binding protein [Verrucomicrobiota bacterium]